MMVTEKVSAQDLYPSASELFRPAGKTKDTRARRLALTWLLAGALVALVGRRILGWIDRNI